MLRTSHHTDEPMKTPRTRVVMPENCSPPARPNRRTGDIEAGVDGDEGEDVSGWQGPEQVETKWPTRPVGCGPGRPDRPAWRGSPGSRDRAGRAADDADPIPLRLQEIADPR